MTLQRIQEYYEKQEKIKNYIAKNPTKTIAGIAQALKIAHRLPKALVRNKIILIDQGGFFKWNEKIPNSTVLAKSTIKTVNLFNSVYVKRIPKKKSFWDKLKNFFN